MMKLESLGYVGVGTPKTAEFQRFGTEILGTPVWTEPNDGVVRLRLDERAYRLAVHPDERDRLLYIGWEVAGAMALDEAVAALRSKGVEVETGDEKTRQARHIEGLATFRDPWGFRHELFHGAKTLASFKPTRDISGFLTGEEGMGHVVLLVPDRGAAIRFFVDVMGFRLSDTIPVPFPLAFFHCNARHHSLAVGQAGPIKGLHHVMLELRDLDDVGRTYDLCKKAGVPFAMRLGRHSNDRMTSFYLRTPGGFEVEYGWGGVKVDDATWKVEELPLPSTWGHDHVDNGPPTTVEPA